MAISDDRSDQTPNWAARGSPALAILRIAALGGLCLSLLALAPIRALRKQPFPRRLVRRWHAGTCAIAGLEPAIHGAPVTNRPVLFVANHVSYLDISILGALLDASFVAKSDVRGWPVFGYLAVLQRTVFIERRARRSTDAQRNAMRDRLGQGGSLILFPEGTSSDGTRALRFKSALFDAAATDWTDGQIDVQPISIAYSRFDGMPMGRMLRPFYAWYGDMELAPHLWRAIGLGQAGVDVVFHEPVRMSDFASRKDLARHCERVVANGLSGALTGRYARTAPAQEPRYDGFDLPFAPKSA
ncbi:MAG: lysophospholipid acyltransferase family protein [Alphaproteobacteria bacterium]|nr:lysophospholipid acyltransferase family protein [Alphaproteobacteria bacterium]